MTHKVVSRDEWVAARKAFLAAEKEFTRARDRLSERRRELPWVKVDKTYIFDGPGGKETLSDLFAGKGQLIVQHFMFDPSWDAGCKSCSFLPGRQALSQAAALGRALVVVQGRRDERSVKAAVRPAGQKPPAFLVRDPAAWMGKCLPLGSPAAELGQEVDAAEMLGVLVAVKGRRNEA